MRIKGFDQILPHGFPCCAIARFLKITRRQSVPCSACSGKKFLIPIAPFICSGYGFCWPKEIPEMKTGPVQNSPPEKALPEPGPWSPVKRKARDIGPFDCTKYLTNLPS